MSTEPTAKAYAHGLAARPSGPGSYAAIVTTPTGRRVEQHAYRHTTRDRMAIPAATTALRQCPPNSTVVLHLDNRRVYDAVAGGKLEAWRFDDWKARVGRKPIKNADLWQELDKAMARRYVSVVLANSKEVIFCRLRPSGEARERVVPQAHRFGLRPPARHDAGAVVTQVSTDPDTYRRRSGPPVRNTSRTHVGQGPNPQARPAFLLGLDPAMQSLRCPVSDPCGPSISRTTVPDTDRRPEGLLKLSSFRVDRNLAIPTDASTSKVQVPNESQ